MSEPKLDPDQQVAAAALREWVCNNQSAAAAQLTIMQDRIEELEANWRSIEDHPCVIGECSHDRGELCVAAIINHIASVEERNSR